jgi:hypothetical protein
MFQKNRFDQKFQMNLMCLNYHWFPINLNYQMYQ